MLQVGGDGEDISAMGAAPKAKPTGRDQRPHGGARMALLHFADLIDRLVAQTIAFAADTDLAALEVDRHQRPYLGAAEIVERLDLGGLHGVRSGGGARLDRGLGLPGRLAARRRNGFRRLR